MESVDDAPGLPVSEGTLIAGKYVVERLLATGGMGVVAEGRHEILDQRVAIKFLRPETAKRNEAVQRFLREARSAARIESDHIVRVFDVGIHGEIPYMVMEYLEGIDLGDLLDQRGPLPVGVAIDAIVQALDGLAQAHALGIVHRDLKPANLFLAERADRTRSKRVKVLDFGISKLMPESARLDGALTATSSLLGSPGYMSPEQVRSTKNVDARTDVWSIGVILYELLTGEHAFPGETLGDVFAKIREEPLKPIGARCPGISPELERVIMKCLERDRDARYADAGELLDALLPFATGAPSARALSLESASVRAATNDVRPMEKASTHATWSAEEPERPRRRRFAFAIAVALGAATVAAGTWFFGVFDRRSPASANPPLVAEKASASTAPRPPDVEVSAPLPINGEPALAAPSIVSAAETASATAPPPRVFGPRPGQAPVTPRTATPPASAPSGKKRDDLGI